MESDFSDLPDNNIKIELAFKKFQLFLNKKSIQEFYIYYTNLDKLKLTFFYENISENYYDIENSVDILEKLLAFQYSTPQKIQEFLIRLVNILDKKIAKKNTMYIHGDTCSGKSYFFDCVVHYFCNFGLIHDFKKHTNFQFQDCVSRRVLLWNEPTIEIGSLEKMKTVLGGDGTKVDIKYKEHVTIKRTPIIILSNNWIFPKQDDTFNTRIYYESWKTCHHLKNLDKKPYPLAFYHLLIRFNVFNNI